MPTLVKPFVYAVADERYWHIYGKAFLNSARAHGHRAKVFRVDGLADSIEQKTRCATERFRLMPGVVRKHGAALALDVDAIICAPVEIEPEYDIGLFIRHAAPERHKIKLQGQTFDVCAKVLAGMFYCAPSGLEFAEDVADALTVPPTPQWGEDQDALWDAYLGLGHKFRTKVFDQSHMNWEHGSRALIYAAKGRSKAGGAFLKKVEHWRRDGAC